MSYRRDRFAGFVVSLGVLLAAGSGCGGGGAPDLAPPLPADTTPPQITGISGISDGDTIATAVVFTATATDDTGIASFRLTVGGTKVVDARLTEIVYVWDVRQIEPGPYELVFTAADAAGNIDTRTLTVTVSHDGDQQPQQEPEPTPGQGPDPKPEPDPEPQEPKPTPGQEPAEPVVLDTQPAEPFDYVLPPMDPALYNPQDSGTPSILLVGIKNNDVLYGTRTISATATDDTGVNVITMLVDGYQVVLAEGYSLYYEWDTTEYEDGGHTVTFVVRDNGANVGQCSLEVTIDNTTDHTGPAIDALTSSSWSFGEFSGSLADVRESIYGWWCDAMGVVHLRVIATDPQGVAEMRISVEGGESSTANGGYIEYDLHTDTDTWYRSYTVTIDAVDTLGNSSFCQLLISSINNCKLSGYVKAANGIAVEDAEVMVLPGRFDSPAEIDPSAAIAADETSSRGRFEFYPVPSGTYTLYVRHGTYEEVVPLELLLRTQEFLSGDDTVVLGAKHGSPEPNKRLAIVTGSGDDVPAAIDTMLTTLFHCHANPEPGRRQLPEGVDLIDGDNSLAGGEPDFMEFVSDPALLSRYRYMIIESGNVYEAQWLDDPATVAALRGWVEDGGQLVLTGQSYDFMEQMYPETHDFAGSDELDGWGAIPEAHNAAQEGQDAMVIGLSERLKTGHYTSWDMPRMLSKRGQEVYPPVSLPAGWPLILEKNYQLSVLTGLHTTTTVPRLGDLADLVTIYEAELGRVVLICYPVAQPAGDASNLHALILDLLTFDGE